MTNPHRISLGVSTVIYDGARLDVIGPPLHSEFGSLSIGDGTSIEPNVHIAAAADMVIGSNVVLASSVYISDHDHGYQDVERSPLDQPLVVQPVTIEDNVWIGERGVVLKGVTIGHHSIVGANSVVTRSIPPYSIAVGSPARVVRTWKP
jgi:lipopolysaccharide O-acetyltransferase